MPALRTTDFTEVLSQLTKTGGFLIRQVFYPALSQLIGQRLRVHVYDDHIEALVSATFVVSHPRRRGRDDGQRVIASIAETESMSCDVARKRFEGRPMVTAFSVSGLLGAWGRIYKEKLDK